MHPSNDLSRSLVPFEYDATVCAVVELSQTAWLVGGIVPGIDRHPEKKIPADEQVLLRLLHRWRDTPPRTTIRASLKRCFPDPPSRPPANFIAGSP